MKKTFLFSAMVAMMSLVACSPAEEDAVVGEISIDPTSIEASAEETIEVIELSSNVAWTAEVDADWVTLSAESGEGDAAVTVTVAENKVEIARTTDVVFSTTDGVEAILSINQEAASAAIDPSVNPFEIKVVDETSSDIVLEVDPTFYNGNWFMGVVGADVFDDAAEGFAGNKADLAETMMFLATTPEDGDLNGDGEGDGWGFDLSTPNGAYLFQGYQSEVHASVWSLIPETEFVIVIFACDEFGNILSDISVTRGTTTEGMTFDFKFENITSTSADYTVTPSILDEYYFVTILDGEGYDNFVSQAQAQGASEFDMQVAILDGSADADGSIPVGQGVLTSIGYEPLSPLDPATEYVFVTYGLSIKDNSITGFSTGICTGRFTTLSAAGAPAKAKSIVSTPYLNVELPAAASLKAAPAKLNRLQGKMVR